MTGDHCFQDIPRTVDSALESGWRKIDGSTCRNGGRFFGQRMAKGDDYAVTPLYDAKGTIAGIQVNVSKVQPRVFLLLLYKVIPLTTNLLLEE